MAADLLDMDHINSLPQPLFAMTWHGTWWPVHDIEVQTGLVRIDVCGKLDVKPVGDIRKFRDDIGHEHEPDDFYVDPKCWINRTGAQHG